MGWRHSTAAPSSELVCRRCPHPLLPVDLLQIFFWVIVALFINCCTKCMILLQCVFSNFCRKRYLLFCISICCAKFIFCCNMDVYLLHRGTLCISFIVVKCVFDLLHLQIPRCCVVYHHFLNKVHCFRNFLLVF